MEWTPALAFQGLLLSTLLALGIANLRRRPWLAFGILWFFLQLAPTNSLVPRLDVANDRQVYLACWGLFFALAAQIEWPRVVAIALCLLFAGASVMRQLDYRDEITLWEASVRSSPWNARAHNNLGYAYYQAGRKPEAKREFQTALFLDRTEKKARANLVLLDWRLGAITLLAFPLVLILTQWFRRNSSRAYRSVRQAIASHQSGV